MNIKFTTVWKDSAYSRIKAEQEFVDDEQLIPTPGTYPPDSSEYDNEVEHLAQSDSTSCLIYEKGNPIEISIERIAGD